MSIRAVHQPHCAMHRFGGGPCDCGTDIHEPHIQNTKESMGITNDEIKRLRELMAKATPGPWQAQSSQEWPGAVTKIRSASSPLDWACYGELATGSKDDVQFIVALVNAAPKLLEAAHDQLIRGKTGKSWGELVNILDADPWAQDAEDGYGDHEDVDMVMVKHAKEYVEEARESRQVITDLRAKLDQAQREVESTHAAILRRHADLDEARAKLAAVSGERDHYLACFKQTTSPAESCREERAAGNGGCGACSICCAELREERDRLGYQLAETKEEVNESDLEKSITERDAALAEVAALKAERDEWKNARNEQALQDMGEIRGLGAQITAREIEIAMRKEDAERLRGTVESTIEALRDPDAKYTRFDLAYRLEHALATPANGGVANG